ncbi:MAG TPA: cobyrinate a,c-diamide synthase, partial [Acidimicrobiales bacterium]|nr:cobyrinate a,c-diamide synthase [Acidimicrobiales bacterium]
GLAVRGSKVGPDFIDPGYHALATGAPSRNLDAWICGEQSIPALAARAAGAADLLVVEGVMGLFDGAAPSPDRVPPAGLGPLGLASTAHIASVLAAPVILVVDGSSLSGSVAAIIHGYATFSSRVSIAGVILNRVGSDSHEEMLRASAAETSVPVLGVLRRDPALTWRDRHLGLVPVVESPARVEASLAELAAAIEGSCDLDAIARIAATAEEVHVDPLAPTVISGRARIAVAGGKAFSFVYPDNLERLAEAGGEILEFDPMTADSLPEGTDAVYIGGGFPEVYAAELSANAPLINSVRAHVQRGGVTWAECGGLVFLSKSLDGSRLCGVLPTLTHMTQRLSLGYRRATVRTASPLADAGDVLLGHEFHYSTSEPAGDALEITGRTGTNLGGFASPTLLASYLHLHLGADPRPAERLVAAATRPS